MRISIRERFAPKWTPEPFSGCWLWTAGCKTEGYGVLRVNGKYVAAHRVSWQLHNGTIPDGLCVCHHCDTPPCVNPNHLFLGTRKDNTDDCIKKGRKCILVGIESPRAKLTDDQVRFIRSSETGSRQLASRFEVHQATIYRIRKGTFWKHLL